MTVANLIFISVLFAVGVWCILLVHDTIKKNMAAKSARDEAFAEQACLPVISPQQALVRARAAARKEEAQKRAEIWKSLTPSLVSQAFNSFYRDEGESGFDSSTVSAAFEKFTEEMRVRR